MAYVKQTWVDQEGQVRYSETTDGDYKIFTPNYEEVTEIGTPVNALHMNHIEDGIEQCYTDFENMIKAIYPVGAIYIGMTNTCPLASLFGTWTKISGGLTLQQADSNHAVGTEIPAGLPNIYGQVIRRGQSEAPTDAFYIESGSYNRYKYEDGNGKKIMFDASRVSSVYSNDISTVQPPALAVNIWQRTA